MADTNRDRPVDQRGVEQQGPTRPEIIEQREALREDVDDQSSYQARPEAQRPVRARETETGTADRAERAAGLEPDEQHFDDARRAAEESRGDERPRDQF